MLGLQLDNKIAAIQVFLVFLEVQEGQSGGGKKKNIPSVLIIAYLACLAHPVCVRATTHGEVESFRLLLIGSSLADVGFAHVGVGGGRFHRLGGLAVLEGLGNVKVFHGEHVLEGLHGCVKCLPHLAHTHKHTQKHTHITHLHWLLILWATYAKLEKHFSISVTRGCNTHLSLLSTSRVLKMSFLQILQQPVTLFRPLHSNLQALNGPARFD